MKTGGASAGWMKNDEEWRTKREQIKRRAAGERGTLSL